MLIIALGGLVVLSIMIIFLTSFVLRRRSSGKTYSRKTYSRDEYVPKKKEYAPSKFESEIDEALDREVKASSKYVQKGSSLIEEIMGMPVDSRDRGMTASGGQQYIRSPQEPTRAVALSGNNNIRYNSLDVDISKEIDREFEKEFGIPYDEETYANIEREEGYHDNERYDPVKEENFYDFNYNEPPAQPVASPDRKSFQETRPRHRNELEDMISSYDEEFDDIVATSNQHERPTSPAFDQDRFLEEKVDEYEKRVDKEYPACFGTSEKYDYCNKDCGFTSSCKKVIEVINKI